jgi:hypothetical protein
MVALVEGCVSALSSEQVAASLDVALQASR